MMQENDYAEGEGETTAMEEEVEEQEYGDEDWVLCRSRRTGHTHTSAGSSGGASSSSSSSSSASTPSHYWFHTRTATRFWSHVHYPYDKIAIIVPFRDLHIQQHRSQQLAQFIPKMESFLMHSQMPFKIFIIEQSNDKRKFNRGKLLNVGFVLAEHEDYTAFIFHDVDLIPSLDLLPYYACKPKTNQPIHIAKVWNRYNRNPDYFGGIVNFSKEQYEALNGYPNNFWGWGGEDDELMKRVKKCNFQAEVPSSGDIEDMEDMSLDQKLTFLKQQATIKCMNKIELLNEHEKSWQENGINAFRDSEQFIVQNAQYLSDFCVKYTVELAPNFHWSDNVCGENDKQY